MNLYDGFCMNEWAYVYGSVILQNVGPGKYVDKVSLASQINADTNWADKWSA